MRTFQRLQTIINGRMPEDDPLSRTFSKTIFRASSDRLDTVTGAMDPRVRREIETNEEESRK
jgi:hypothetical protein